MVDIINPSTPVGTKANDGSDAGQVVVADIYGAPAGAETRIAHISGGGDFISWADNAAIVSAGKTIMFDTFTNSPTKARIILLSPQPSGGVVSQMRCDWLVSGVNEGSHANYETLFELPHIAITDTGSANIDVRMASAFMPVIEYDLGDTVISDIGIMAVITAANTSNTEGDCVVICHAW